jgi:hypothetical protein
MEEEEEEEEKVSDALVLFLPIFILSLHQRYE